MFTSAKKNFSLLCFLVLCHQTFALDYRQIFGGHYVKAEKKIADIRPLIQHYAKAYGEDCKLIEAVIFPEVMRYNSVYDAVETGSLIGLYSRFGADYANFSIGLLQMKPTFAESLEKEILKDSGAPWVIAMGFDKISLTDDHKSRMARVNRLMNTEWQLKYFIAMMKCLELKHRTSKMKNDDRLLFIASAYNCGWDKSRATIKSYITKKYYHLGNWGADKKYAFADVALYHFIHCHAEERSIFKKTTGKSGKDPSLRSG